MYPSAYVHPEPDRIDPLGTLRSVLRIPLVQSIRILLGRSHCTLHDGHHLSCSIVVTFVSTHLVVDATVHFFYVTNRQIVPNPFVVMISWNPGALLHVL